MNDLHETPPAGELWDLHAITRAADYLHYALMKLKSSGAASPDLIKQLESCEKEIDRIREDCGDANR